jgi:basic membrane protein A
LTRSNKLGYVAAAPIPHILRSINAFTLGAQFINPKITTTIVWTNGWNNPDKEASATHALADQGVDVVSVKVDSPVAVVQTAEKRGILSVGHYGDASRFAPNGWIVGTFQNWGPMMVRMIREVEDGTWKPRHWLGDLAGGDIVLTTFGSKVTPELQARIATVRSEFQTRKRMIWTGPLVDQAGTELVGKGQTLAEEKIPVMDFLVQGVVGSTH